MSRKMTDRTGDKIGFLLVEEMVGRDPSNGKYLWRCLCRLCGERVVRTSSALSGSRILTCGCIKPRLTSLERHKHGLAYGEPLYFVWSNMKNKCYNSNYTNYDSYGGIGIGVCQDWKNDPEAFFDWAIDKGYQKGMMIHREDILSDFSPDNCYLGFDRQVVTQNKVLEATFGCQKG